MSMNPVHEINELDFNAEVLEARVPVLVEFTAEWCPPCRALAPILHKVAEEGAGRLKVVAVNGDRSPALARRFGIRGLPTVVAFAGGKEVARHVGLTTKEKLLKLVEGRELSAGARGDRAPSPL
ncbi:MULTISPECIES: co-chaperone YbbN [Sorangium]|uniref:Thioredoxin n=1 Tax=Sorangium cellulosum TaxID=56 RepID=A0A4P2QLG1_SORCE|nr:MULTISPECIES: thioredoxin family protein [Sorangium]AUX30820.1 thioredoxin [Sorangium cellulosum]WCQ90201.1 Thioredoxin 1 [Sorangium sp. Soce836]